ncbi:MAG: YcaO-like family protein [Desulfobacterales bacterium]|nr:YcaO-like family protein [Desulfobacterales bacterium]
MLLKDAIKGYTLDQDKLISPTDTVIKFKAKIKEIGLNILENTVRIDNGRLNIPVYFSICGPDSKSIIGTKKQMGKGATSEQAEASAVMELAERYSFFSFCKNKKNFFIDTYRNLRDKAISFDLLAKSVHDDSDEIKVIKEILYDIPLKWTSAYNLTENKELFIPFDWFFTINEFNGPSAGNCMEEAVCQGICEIVERHVCALISNNKISVPAISIESVKDLIAIELIKKYQKNNIKLFISDFTLDMGIPTIGIAAYDPYNYPDTGEVVWTAGTTPNPNKALIRALTETAQLAGDFNTHSNYVASGLPKIKTIEEISYITNPNETISISSLTDIANINIKSEIQNCISALKNKGMEVIIIDTTHPTLKIPACYVIIPGAHFRERSLNTGVGMFTAKIIAEKQNPIDAIRYLKKIDQVLNNKYYIKFFLGYCHLNINEFEEAIKYFNQSADLNSNSQDTASIYSYMGLCFKELGLYQEALNILKKGEACDNERTDIFNLMGYCYFKLKEHENSIKCFNKVIELNPSSAIDYANIASNYRDMGKLDKAKFFYETALEIDPTIDFAKDNLEKLKQIVKT